MRRPKDVMCLLATDTDTSKFAKNADLGNLKSNFDSLDIDKFKTVTVDLSKLSDAVNKLSCQKD